MRTCVVCKKFSMPGHNDVSFHKFPCESTLREKWMLAIGISSVTKSATVCSDHFDESAYHQTDGYTSLKRLLPNAVPMSQSISYDNKENETSNAKEGVVRGNIITLTHDGLSDDDNASMTAEKDSRITENSPADEVLEISALVSELPTPASVFEDIPCTADDTELENSISMCDKFHKCIRFG